MECRVPSNARGAKAPHKNNFAANDVAQSLTPMSHTLARDNARLCGADARFCSVPAHRDALFATPRQASTRVPRRQTKGLRHEDRCIQCEVILARSYEFCPPNRQAPAAAGIDYLLSPGEAASLYSQVSTTLVRSRVKTSNRNVTTPDTRR